MARIRCSKVRIDAQFTLGVWTELADVLTDPGITWRRGKQGNGPKDRVAATGVLEFALKNSATNSGATRAWYSPNSPSVRPGWNFGTPVRLVATYAGTDYALFTGKVRTILPTTIDQRAYCTAQDAIGDAADFSVREVNIWTGATEADLIQAIIDVMPADSQPPAVSLDTGLDTYPVAFDNIGDGANALSLWTQVVLSALGSLYAARDGTLTYVNRHSLAVAGSAFAVTDTSRTIPADDSNFSVPSSLANVYNRVRLTIHPKTLSTSPTDVLYASPGVVAVPAGSTIVLWGTYKNQSNALQIVGGTDFQTPIAAGTDYAGNSAADGSGADLTADLGIVTIPFASTVQFSITNHNATQTIYLVDGAGAPLLQLRGRPIYDNAPLTAESFLEQNYGNKILDIDLPLQDDINVAQGLRGLSPQPIPEPERPDRIGPTQSPIVRGADGGGAATRHRIRLYGVRNDDGRQQCRRPRAGARGHGHRRHVPADRGTRGAEPGDGCLVS
jgi:hypothetical protein